MTWVGLLWVELRRQWWWSTPVTSTPRKQIWGYSGHTGKQTNNIQTKTINKIKAWLPAYHHHLGACLKWFPKRSWCWGWEWNECDWGVGLCREGNESSKGQWWYKENGEMQLEGRMTHIFEKAITKSITWHANQKDQILKLCPYRTQIFWSHPRHWVRNSGAVSNLSLRLKSGDQRVMLLIIGPTMADKPV